MQNYGGCDGVVVDGVCETEPRTADNDFFPTRMTPRGTRDVDLPFDDVNDPIAFARRGEVVPWADEPGCADRISDPDFSLMKNRWVEMRRGAAVCFGQIQDAGPGEYHDIEYVFGDRNARPANRRYNGAGMDVSPALNGCLGFTSLDGNSDVLDWRFVDDEDVPPGPWTRLITTTPADPP